MQLYLGNLPPEVDEPLLYELISQLAPVSSVRMPKHKIKQTYQGYGFATFSNELDAQYVLNVLNETNLKLYGRTLKVSTAQRVPGNANTITTLTAAQIQAVPRVFVGNLDPNTTEESELVLPFSKFGNVVSTQIVKSPEKCHAFVRLSSIAAAEQAISELNGQYILNRKVKLAFER